MNDRVHSVTLGTNTSPAVHRCRVLYLQPRKEQSTEFELAINLKTAKTPGFYRPTSLPLRPDEVIEEPVVQKWHEPDQLCRSGMSVDRQGQTGSAHRPSIRRYFPRLSGRGPSEGRFYTATSLITGRSSSPPPRACVRPLYFQIPGASSPASTGST